MPLPSSTGSNVNTSALYGYDIFPSERKENRRLDSQKPETSDANADQEDSSTSDSSQSVDQQYRDAARGRRSTSSSSSSSRSSSSSSSSSNSAGSGSTPGVESGMSVSDQYRSRAPSANVGTGTTPPADPNSSTGAATGGDTSSSSGIDDDNLSRANEQDSGSGQLSDYSSAGSQPADANSTSLSSSVINPQAQYTLEDLIGFGLSPKVAQLLLIMDGQGSSGKGALSGAAITELVNSGELTLNSNGNNIALGVNVSPQDGYSTLEVLESTNLTSAQAQWLVFEHGEGGILSSTKFNEMIDPQGNLKQNGQSGLQRHQIDTAEVKGVDAFKSMPPGRTFDASELQKRGLPPEIAQSLTSKGPISAANLTALVAKGDLVAGVQDNQLMLGLNTNFEQIPKDGVSVLRLVGAGIPLGQAQFLMQAFGENGILSAEETQKHVKPNPDTGNAQLSQPLKKAWQSNDKPMAEVAQGGISYVELLGMGLTAKQATYVMSQNEHKPGSNTMTIAAFNKLKQSGKLIPEGNGATPEFRLQGEGGVPQQQAAQQARTFAGNRAGTQKPVVEIAPDGTGNFYQSRDSEKPGGLDTQQSVVHVRAKDKNGNRTGEMIAFNGDAHGNYNRNQLLDLGFSKQTIDAMQAKYGPKHGVFTATEIKHAIANNVGGAQQVAQVKGNAVVMVPTGKNVAEASSRVQDENAPTQEEAQWLNRTYGGGDGLNEQELAVALKDGVVAMKDGKLGMTEHGRALAMAEYGPSSNSVDQIQAGVVKKVFNQFAPNANGEPKVDLKTLISMYNGQLSKGDAQMILQTFGDGKTISQGQLLAAVKSGDVMVSSSMKKEGTPSEYEAFNLEITPKGYETMLGKILNNPNHPSTKIVDGIINFPNKSGLTTIDQTQLQQRHGLKSPDAAALVSNYDQNGDMVLDRKEMLRAVLDGAVQTNANHKITGVNVESNSKVVRGPYTDAASLAKKFKGTEPPGEDIANAIFLDYGLDPANPESQLSEAQVEAWNREHRMFTEDNNGLLTVVDNTKKGPEAQQHTNGIWQLLSPGGNNHAYIPVGRGGFPGDVNLTSDTTSMSRGEIFGLGNYLVKQDIGVDQHEGDKKKSESYQSITKEEVGKLVKDGIIELDANGKITLTPKGKAVIKAQQGADAINHIESVQKYPNESGFHNGSREIYANAWEGDFFQQHNGEDWSRGHMRDNGFTNVGHHDNVSIHGLYWSISNGHEFIHPRDSEGVYAHESIGADEYEEDRQA